jgi:protein-S-isoprenylcysteine O-methyltransferase Ste14
MRLAQFPPSYLNLLIIFVFIFHYITPIKILIPSPYSYIGIIFIISGLILNIWSGSSLRKRATPIEFDAAPQELVTDGPYRISRNPIYLSGLIIFLGIAITLGSLITFAFPIALVLILDQVYIPLEEIVLEESFGDQYRAYKKRVRRWV